MFAYLKRNWKKVAVVGIVAAVIGAGVAYWAWPPTEPVEDVVSRILERHTAETVSALEAIEREIRRDAEGARERGKQHAQEVLSAPDNEFLDMLNDFSSGVCREFAPH